MISLIQLVAAVTVMVAPCPTYTLPYSCYEPGSQTIYLAARDVRKPFVLMHEYGHADDWTRLTPADHRRLKRLLGYPQSRAWMDAGRPEQRDAPAEAYADAFADCALGRASLNVKVCNMLPMVWRNR